MTEQLHDPQNLRNKRMKVGDVDFDCPNCGRHLHRVLWETASEFELDEKGNYQKIVWGYGPVTAVAQCSCGKTWLAGETDYDGTVALFDLTRKDP